MTNTGELVVQILELFSEITANVTLVSWKKDTHHKRAYAARH